MFGWMRVFRRTPKYWRCPGCGALLEKKADGADKVAVFAKIEKMGARVTNLARCAECGITVDAKDVYSGKYDTRA